MAVILGMRGIGKTRLAVKFCSDGMDRRGMFPKLAREIQNEFDCFVWRSLISPVPLGDILADAIGFLSDHQEKALPDTEDRQMEKLIHHLRTRRCLLIWNGGYAGEYQEGYEGYGRLLRQIGELPHQSCLLVTSREKPGEIAGLNGESAPVRSRPSKLADFLCPLF